MVFDSFYGNEKLIKSLAHELKSHTLPHAIMIYGESGMGAGYLSELLARSVICENGGCGVCAACKKSQKGIHPDIIVIDRGGENIPISEIREIGKTIHLYPNDSDRKVYIIKNAHNMNAAAQNALLKLLEEPPKFASFILSVSKKDKILRTVLSRCMVINLSTVTTDEVCLYLEREKKIKHDEAWEIAKISAGNIGRALILSDKRAGKREIGRRAFALDVINTLCFSNEFSFLMLQKRFADEKTRSKDERDAQSGIFDVISELLSDILRYQNGLSPVTFSDNEEELHRISNILTAHGISLLFSNVEYTQSQIARNINYSACINSFLMRAWEDIHDRNHRN